MIKKRNAGKISRNKNMGPKDPFYRTLLMRLRDPNSGQLRETAKTTIRGATYQVISGNIVKLPK
ncbi:MAG: hypothetical protein ABIH20_03300 [Candidatus Diapherotrites archaeon]